MINSQNQVNLGYEKRRKKTELTSKVRERRYFSESAHRSIVEEIDGGLSKAEASRKYGVSQASIFKWIQMYSKKYTASLVKVVESKSESNRYKHLSVELEQVYAQLGRAKSEIDFLNAIIHKADEAYETDLKKNFDIASCLISTGTKKKTR